MGKHDTLLLACGTSEKRAVLRAAFEQKYNILEASSLNQAKMLLEHSYDYIAAVLLDISDFQITDLIEMNQITLSQEAFQIPLIVLTSQLDEHVAEHLFAKGISDIIMLPCFPVLLEQRVQAIIEANLQKVYFDEMVDQKAHELSRSGEDVIDVLSSALEHHSVEVGNHVLCIRHFTEVLLHAVAESCPEYHLNNQMIQDIIKASALHDIGKIAVPISLLNKPGVYTPDERAQMQMHTIAGCSILDSLGESSENYYYEYARTICRYHHERWDGKGYPEGLSGDAIPICAQIVGLADAYDALVSKRTYRDAYSMDHAANMILSGECGAFSPKLLECFKQVIGNFIEFSVETPHTNTDESVIPAHSIVNYADTDSAFELSQAKYLAVLQYVNACVVELDLDQHTYHVIYNPDPNLQGFSIVKNYNELFHYVIEKLLVPEDSDILQKILYDKLPAMYERQSRREHLNLHIKNLTGGQPIPYRLTLLRVSISDSSRRRMIAIWEEVSSENLESNIKKMDQEFLASAVFSTLDRMYAIRYDAHYTCERFGKDMISLFGYTPDEIKVKCGNRLIELMHPNDRERVVSSTHMQLSKGNSAVVEFRMLHKNGSYVWILSYGYLCRSRNGQEFLYAIMIDMTQSKRLEEVLQQTLERQAIILEQTENVIFEYDIASNEATFSNKWKTIFGYEPLTHQIDKRLLSDAHFHPEDAPLAVEAFKQLTSGELNYKMFDMRVAKADGRYLWCQVRITMQCDSTGKPMKMIGVIINIDAEKRAARILQEQAEHDSLSGLLNKEAGKNYVMEYLRQGQYDAPAALMIIDLDNFKQVNDKYGHLTGDSIITDAAVEIKKLFRSNDVIARIGGDEFMVLMKHIPAIYVLKERLATLINIFRTKISDKVPYANLGCSIGVALFPEHGVAYQELFEHADQALYQVKSQGKNTYRFYDPDDPSMQDHHDSVPARLSPIDSDQSSIVSKKGLFQYTFKELYESENVIQTVSELLSVVGKRLDVSRSYIFENNLDNTACSNTFEWCNEGIWPEIQNLQNLSYETDLPGYQNNFNAEGIFYCSDIRDLPKVQYEVLAPQGIKSMLQCSILDHGVFRGFVGFDACDENYLWTQEQIDALAFFSEMLSVFLLKQRAQDEKECRVKNLSSILENQLDRVYVIEPDTFEILYMNERAKAAMPQAKVGQLCYECLAGLNHPCPDCTVKQVEKYGRGVKFNVELQKYMEMTCIQWNGKPAYLVTSLDEKDIQS